MVARCSLPLHHLEKYLRSRQYVIEHVSVAWLLVEDATRPRFPVRTHDHLASIGTRDIRWFSRDESNARAAGRELPYWPR
jgi:hypothetical protein